MSELDDEVIPRIRAQARFMFEARFQPSDRSRFDAVRQAMVVDMVLQYLGVDLIEARSLPAEVKELCMRLMDAHQMGVAMRGFL
jgi:hypothetical protein